MARLVHGFVGEDKGWVDWFVGSWRDLADGRGGSIGSWVHGAISSSHGGDEDGNRFVGLWRDLVSRRGGSINLLRDLTVAWRGWGRRYDRRNLELDSAISLSLSVWVPVSPFSLSLRVSGNDLKVKQKLKIFFESKGLFYGQSKWFTQKLYFSCATKHTVSCKRISRNRF